MKSDFFEKIYHHPLLSSESYAEIAGAHSRVEFSQSDLLLETGRTANEFFVIEKGLFRSFLYDVNGNEITYEFYCPNEILIESFSLFQRIPSRENFQAVTGGVAWKIRYDDFYQLLQRVEGFREWGRSWATRQLFVLKQRSINSLTVSATERYLTLVKDRPDIILHSPIKYIATYLGITDTSLSRIRKEIAAQ